MEKTKKLDDVIRRLGTRVALEFIQGIRTQAVDPGPIPENVEESLNNPYINREGIPLAMDIFKPIGPEYDGKELPVIVSIHGGGLVTGDRKISLQICRELASRGYLVFALEYRLAPRATVCEQFDDVCAGMDLVGRKLVRYDVDFSRIFMIADSAGALLAIYTASMKNSTKLQEAIGYEPSRMVFRALGLSCGMFYTNRNDILGQMLSEQFYGDKLDDENFLQYMNPEHPEIVNNLPPTILITSRGDFLNNYTVMYEKALKKAGNTTKMLYYPGKELTHTFNFSKPWLPESKDANDKMLAFFEEQADIGREKYKNRAQEKRKIRAIHTQMEKGKFAAQKMWEAVNAANVFSEERLDTIAVMDDSKKYTYRQMFRKWDEYAGVFSSIGMTGADHARVAVPGAMTTEAVFSFYALNKIGASVSMIPYEALKDQEGFLKMLKDEKITDVILTDFEVGESLLTSLKDKKDELGIGNVILLGTEAGRKQNKAGKLKKMIEKAEGFSFMPELLIKYEAMPFYVPEEDAEVAVIILHKKINNTFVPVEFSDEGLNTFTFETINDIWDKSYVGRNRMGLTADLSMSVTLAKQMHYSMLLNYTLVISRRVGYNKNFYKAIEKYQINTLAACPALLDNWKDQLKGEKLNFSSLDHIWLEDIGLSKDKLQSYQKFLDKQKGNTLVEISEKRTLDYSMEMPGYGIPGKGSGTEASALPIKMHPMPGVPYVPGMMPDNTKPAHSSEEEERRKGRIESIKTVVPAVLKMVAESKKKDADKEKPSDKGSIGAFMEVVAVLFAANKTDYYYED